ncbi:MAG: hypothetical protein PW791_11450 [Neorhizobium sp.]|jgi:hypothetical protein|nr:hypothetical protein [Neorhizobium sp.]
MPVEIAITTGLAIGIALLFHRLAAMVATFRENLAGIRRTYSE